MDKEDDLGAFWSFFWWRFLLLGGTMGDMERRSF